MVDGVCSRRNERAEGRRAIGGAHLVGLQRPLAQLRVLEVLGAVGRPIFALEELGVALCRRLIEARQYYSFWSGRAYEMI